MDIIHQSDSRIEFRSYFSSAARTLILIGGLLPLLAPYELLIKPSWRGDITLIWVCFLFISAGAVAVSVFCVCAALFGLSQRVRFDSRGQVLTYAFKAPGLRPRVQRLPFSAVGTLSVKTYNWTEGPDTYNLVAKLSGYRDIEFGHFTERTEAERYLSALERILRGEGSRA